MFLFEKRLVTIGINWVNFRIQPLSFRCTLIRVLVNVGSDILNNYNLAKDKVTTILDWMTTNLVWWDNLLINLIRLKTTLPEKVFSMPLMSLCHKPCVYKEWASDIKWHYRSKSDKIIEITPIFRDFLPNMLYIQRPFFAYYGLYSSLCVLYFAMYLVSISEPNCKYSGNYHQSYFL